MYVQNFFYFTLFVSKLPGNKQMILNMKEVSFRFVYGS